MAHAESDTSRRPSLNRRPSDQTSRDDVLNVSSRHCLGLVALTSWSRLRLETVSLYRLGLGIIRLIYNPGTKP